LSLKTHVNPQHRTCKTLTAIEEGIGQSTQAPSPKQLLQNVISGIFPISTHRVYRLKIVYIQSCWYFRPSFVIFVLSTVAPLPFSWLPPPPPSLCQNTVYTDSVWLGGMWGVESCWRPYSAGVFHSVSDQITYKIAIQYLEGKGASDRKAPAAKSLSRSLFVDEDILHCF
jgi:hypothetical protein